eukprot:TRINITY_DN56755_c0_g1_i1.p1 TRINITY_DN56755_c0_g1~~TRINITY_DN56755_c0_g1_i1.p1  ORF type:complete len:692 (+),score=95.94 TRINITY_DN56755_c0_g1_i1:94-2169(+)
MPSEEVRGARWAKPGPPPSCEGRSPLLVLRIELPEIFNDSSDIEQLMPSSDCGGQGNRILNRGFALTMRPTSGKPFSTSDVIGKVLTQLKGVGQEVETFNFEQQTDIRKLDARIDDALEAAELRSVYYAELRKLILKAADFVVTMRCQCLKELDRMREEISRLKRVQENGGSTSVVDDITFFSAEDFLPPSWGLIMEALDDRRWARFRCGGGANADEKDASRRSSFAKFADIFGAQRNKTVATKGTDSATQTDFQVVDVVAHLSVQEVNHCARLPKAAASAPHVGRTSLHRKKFRPPVIDTRQTLATSPRSVQGCLDSMRVSTFDSTQRLLPEAASLGNSPNTASPVSPFSPRKRLSSVAWSPRSSVSETHAAEMSRAGRSSRPDVVATGQNFGIPASGSSPTSSSHSLSPNARFQPSDKEKLCHLDSTHSLRTSSACGSSPTAATTGEHVKAVTGSGLGSSLRFFSVDGRSSSTDKFVSEHWTSDRSIGTVDTSQAALVASSMCSSVAVTSVNESFVNSAGMCASNEACVGETKLVPLNSRFVSVGVQWSPRGCPSTRSSASSVVCAANPGLDSEMRKAPEIVSKRTLSSRWSCSVAAQERIALEAHGQRQALRPKTIHFGFECPLVATAPPVAAVATPASARSGASLPSVSPEPARIGRASPGPSPSLPVRASRHLRPHGRSNIVHLPV